jgi:hypothetical protein
VPAAYRSSTRITARERSKRQATGIRKTTTRQSLVLCFFCFLYVRFTAGVSPGQTGCRNSPHGIGSGTAISRASLPWQSPEVTLALPRPRVWLAAAVLALLLCVCMCLCTQVMHDQSLDGTLKGSAYSRRHISLGGSQIRVVIYYTGKLMTRRIPRNKSPYFGFSGLPSEPLR